jgi:hypothetical protein
MKNILALLLTFTLVTAAVAQSETQREEAKRVILGQKKTTTSTSTSGEGRQVILGGDNRTVYEYPTASSRDQRINEINRAYDAKIYSIRNNPRLSRSEKDRIIRQLEADRRLQIDAVNNSYSRNRHDDDNDKKEKKNKGNNGNHYGWEKGKGNPHKGNG